jgi:hypothetical protein
MEITPDQVVRAVTEARDTYASNARKLADAGINLDLGLMELRRAVTMGLLLADKELCEMLVRKLSQP